MRQAGDPNWTPRYIILLPGFKANVYIFNGNMSSVRSGITDEYEFPDMGAVATHVISVSLTTENDPPATIPTSIYHGTKMAQWW
jgi:hypothetical protein